MKSRDRSSSSWRALRLADEAAPGDGGPGLDLAGFAGTWVSSDPETRGIRRLALTVRGGELRGRVLGAGTGDDVDWGEVAASAVYAESAASRQGAGFVLHFALGPVESHVQGNLKLGVAVLGVYRSFRDGHRNGFFREFLAREEAAAGADAEVRSLACSKDADFGTEAADGAIDPGPLVGRWKNTHPAPRGLVEIALEPADGAVRLRVWGSGRRGPREWGEVRGELFTCIEEDDAASAAALVSYDFGFMASELQVRQNKGILAVTTFNRFHDVSGRSDYVTRDLFHRMGMG